MRYEYKKLFSSKLMWFVLLLTFAYMVFLPLREVWGNMGEMHQSAKTYETVIENVKLGGLTHSELSQMRNEIFQNGLGENSENYKPKYSKSAVGDLVAIERASRLMSYCEGGFEQDRRELVKGMLWQNAAESRKQTPDSYLIKANEKAIELYNRRIDLKLQSTGLSNDIHYAIFNYSMWEYVMIALCVLMTVHLFSCEYTKGAYRLVNTSKKTVQSLFFKKYLAVISVAVCVLTVQAIFELVMGACVFGLKNLSLPIQQIQMYEYCPYAISIAQFYLFKFLLKVLAYVTIISLGAFVTTLVRRPLVSNIILLPVSAGGLLANMVLFVKIDNSEKYSLSVLSAYDRLRIFLPQSLLNFKEYIKKFDCFSLLGHPVSRLSACIFISFAISALCAFLGYKFSGRTRRSS
ncbi:MAG: hypothetical protein IJ172_11585 [Ruminococcus sp.]|nr:hypothetical protein [Ruminococcus sp.]